MYDTVLYGQEVTVLGIDVLFNRPSEYTVVEDVVVAVFCTESLVLKNITIDVGMS